MFDVFKEEIEVQIKEGIANLYWYRKDLKKSWLRAGVDPRICEELFNQKDSEGKNLTKRQLMDLLYERIRPLDFNRRLEISRNFAGILINHTSFVPQDRNHKIESAERIALKLREYYAQQQKEDERRGQVRRWAAEEISESYDSRLQIIRAEFEQALTRTGQERGYALEKIFVSLMKASNIPVNEPFKIIGEQIDGAIKHDGHHYLVELKWVKDKCNQANIASLFMKVEGKLEARGIFVAMEGYSSEVVESLPKGKNLRVLLLNGVHLANVIYGVYTFQELLEHAISYASLRGEIYCPTKIES